MRVGGAPARGRAIEPPAGHAGYGQAPEREALLGRKRLLTPADWIASGQELLAQKGVDAVRVDVLSKMLGVSRGSFYWHFTDHRDLLDRMLEHWQSAQTEDVIARHNRAQGCPEGIVKELAELPFHGRAAARGAAIELAIRAWAQRDDAARQVVDAVDEQRLDFMIEVFRALGFGAQASRVRSFLLYCYMQSEALFRNQGTARDKAERSHFVAEVLRARPSA